MAARRCSRLALLLGLLLTGWASIGCETSGGNGLPGDATDATLPDGAECFDGDTRCTDEGVETCAGGQWGAPTTCEFGCDAGSCLDTAPVSSCAMPHELTLGAPFHATTVGGLSSHTWSEDCRFTYGFSPTGPEAVFHFSLDQAANVNVSLAAIDPTFFGVYLRSVCDAPGELGGACDGNIEPGDPVTYDYLLGAGDHYVVVDDFGADGEGPGAFDLTVTQTPLPTCHGQVPQLLDVSTGSVDLQGDTASGSTGGTWQGARCDFVMNSAGQENIYAFSLTERSEVQIAATAIDPSPSQIAIYLRDDCEIQFSQIDCGYASGESPAPALIMTTLDAGTYYLFVDDFIGSTDDPQTYSLSIQTTPAP